MESELPQEDLSFILSETGEMWEEMRGQHIFITGGTGFFGRWLLESFLLANRELGLRASATVLTRNAGAFTARVPHLAQSDAIHWHAGDMRTFVFPEGHFSFVIHAATEVARISEGTDPLERIRAIEQGAERVLQFASQRGTRKFLMVSSGAAYGLQPSDMSHIPETYAGAPSTLEAASSYGEGKRLSELMCALYAGQYPMDIKLARCFAFVGPAQPLDAGFAIGNFISDAMAGREIRVAGDGTPTRSYLYAADLAVWLWTMLFRAPALELFNVGSEQSISVLGLAHLVADMLNPEVGIRVAQQPQAGTPPRQYVPATGKARDRLRLYETVSLQESIRRVVAWHSHANHKIV